jgi:hypothetical protein
LEEMVNAVAQEGASEAGAAVVGADAELGDVGDPVGDDGAEEHAGEMVGVLVEDDPGGLGLEDAAAGEADDVVEETDGAVHGAVLVVDAGVEVTGVALVDEAGGGLVVGAGPAA